MGILVRYRFGHSHYTYQCRSHCRQPHHVTGQHVEAPWMAGVVSNPLGICRCSTGALRGREVHKAAGNASRYALASLANQAVQLSFCVMLSTSLFLIMPLYQPRTVRNVSQKEPTRFSSSELLQVFGKSIKLTPSGISLTRSPFCSNSDMQPE